MYIYKLYIYIYIYIIYIYIHNIFSYWGIGGIIDPAPGIISSPTKS